MGRKEDMYGDVGFDKSGVIADASDEELALARDAALNPYVQYVLQHDLRDQVIDHDIKGREAWLSEVGGHIAETYPLEPRLVQLALVVAEAYAAVEGLSNGQA